MSIQMIGIDHSRAAVEIREQFSFTKKQQGEQYAQILACRGIEGCVILSTCNRMEMYVSRDGEEQTDLCELICDLKMADQEKYREYFVCRSGIEAVRHLFSLTAGLESRIVGEDQILSQVKDALAFAREADATDKVLEVLFRRAVTFGKKVRTDINFTHGNHSAIEAAVRQLQENGFDFCGRKCLVIGNGEMGQLTANALREKGASVTVTIRQYRSGQVNIPLGCARINYGERYRLIPECDVVVSATSSPNLTITKADLEQCALPEQILFLDLAVPRDIQPEIETLPGVTRLDIDSFHTDMQSEELRQQILSAEKILKTELQDFISWYECRDIVPVIQNIGKAAASDMVWRMGKTLEAETRSEKCRSDLEREIRQTAEKVVDKLLFRLRDELDTEQLRSCLDILQKYASEQELFNS